MVTELVVGMRTPGAFQLIDRASTAMADGSGTGDTNSGSL